KSFRETLILAPVAINSPRPTRPVDWTPGLGENTPLMCCLPPPLLFLDESDEDRVPFALVAPSAHGPPGPGPAGSGSSAQYLGQTQSAARWAAQSGAGL